MAIKACPPLSLLASFSVQLITFNSLSAIALVWDQFVKEVRWHWERSIFLPRTNFGEPATSSSLLYQKLQLINYCIERKKEWNQWKKEDMKKESHSKEFKKMAALFDGIGDSPKSEESTNKKEDEEGWEDFEVDVDDKGKEEIDEEIEEVKQKNEEMREGVSAKTDMVLIKTGETLCVPITQDYVGFVTEDMIEERQFVMESMGTGGEASATRAKMQTESLLSDMSAFKAANPKCIFEDFVRWHSPRDWILNDNEPKGSINGSLSTRMKEKDGLWTNCWNQAMPIPVRRQKPIFQFVLEAEKVLHFLETISPSFLIQQ